jgi:hypothetical protein
VRTAVMKVWDEVPLPFYSVPARRLRAVAGAWAERFGTSTSSAQMAFGDVGQNSSQTMQGVAIDQGRHRPWSKNAVPQACSQYRCAG